MLNISGTFTGTVTLNATASGNTVNYNGAAQTLKGTAYTNLTLSGSGAKTMPSGTSVTGTLSIPAGGAQALVTTGQNLTVANLTLGGLGRINGTWGFTGSGATNIDTTYFASGGTGTLNVTNDTRSAPTLSVTNSPVTYDGSTHAATVSASVAGSVSNILTGGSATQTNAGTYAVTADFTPTDTTSYTTLTGASAGSFIINQADQTISFGALAGKIYGDADFGVSATSTSGLAPTFTSQTTGVCTVSGATVHIVSAGTCTIRASQAGDSTYNAAPDVDQSFTVATKTLTVTATGTNKLYDGTTVATVT
ncbi:hypothetical protein HYT05_00800, partial [Candidatus Kaiserbacteria bacterium]|nr:hypothetical protein [Candidatus Kaiserbacteria bacterium]